MCVCVPRETTRTQVHSGGIWPVCINTIQYESVEVSRRGCRPEKRRLPLRNKLFEGVFYFQNEIDSSLTFSTPDSICEETNEEKNMGVGERKNC